MLGLEILVLHWLKPSEGNESGLCNLSYHCSYASALTSEEVAILLLVLKISPTI